MPVFEAELRNAQVSSLFLEVEHFECGKQMGFVLFYKITDWIQLDVTLATVCHDTREVLGIM